MPFVVFEHDDFLCHELRMEDGVKSALRHYIQFV
jgi:hypothetical protein